MPYYLTKSSVLCLYSTIISISLTNIEFRLYLGKLKDGNSLALTIIFMLWQKNIYVSYSNSLSL